MTTTELPQTIPFGLSYIVRDESGERVGRITPVSAKTFRATRTNGTFGDSRRVSHFRSIATAHAFIVKGGQS